MVFLDGETYLSIKLQGEGVKLETVKIFDMDGNILEELPLRLNNEKENYYVTKSFRPPNVAFQLSVSAISMVFYIITTSGLLILSV